MTLVVEDGTGLANAQSYVSADTADAYFSARGYTTWVGIQPQEKEQALLRAMGYFESMYLQRWAGLRKSPTQALAWPRSYVPIVDVAVGATDQYWPDDAVPQAVCNALCELAYRATKGELAPDVGRQKRRTKVGPLETEYEPTNGALQRTLYRTVGALVAQFFKPSSGGGNTVYR